MAVRQGRAPAVARPGRTVAEAPYHLLRATGVNSPNIMAAIDTLSPCGQRVRHYDHDRYLTCLFAPDDRREALFAIFAFNHEVAKTREVVREPILGQIRLQWWRDSIAALYAGEVRRHEVIEP